MKGKVFRYITVCSLFLALFALANFYCYQSAMNQFEKMQEDYETRVGEQVQVYVDNEMADRMAQMEKSVRETVQTDGKYRVSGAESQCVDRRDSDRIPEAAGRTGGL